MFKPINPPPSDYHGFAAGLSTELGDNAKTVAEKINAGFVHVYGMLKGMGATLADEVEYVAKSDFDALDEEFTKLLNSHGELSHMVTELKAEINNVKMMVQGLGFAGARGAPDAGTAIDPQASPIAVSGEPVVTVTEKADS